MPTGASKSGRRFWIFWIRRRAVAQIRWVHPLNQPVRSEFADARRRNFLAYIGHDGLMDFQFPQFPQQKDESHREAVVLACASKQFFGDAVASGAYPLLWTTGLMAPEAYTLKSALDGWIAGENREQVRDRAAGAYDKYQKCGIRAAHRLLTTGW